MKIVVLDGFTLNPGDNPWIEVEALGDFTVYDRTPPDKVLERAKDAEIICTNKTVLDKDILDGLPKLRFISVLATGYNVVDLDAARERGIPVSNVPVYSTDSVVQFVFALILEHCHHVSHYSEMIYNGTISKKDFCYWDTDLIELSGKKLGIIGFGKIGRRVGEVAHAMGMEVLAHTRTQRDEPSYKPFAWKSLDDLVAEADIISLHCPLTDENTGMVNKDLLSRMKSSAFLINTGRGGLVNEQDLADALNEEKIAGAAVDVLSVEPVADDNPLLKAKNCVITPHIAWATKEARKRLMGTTAENIRGFITGNPVNVVNG